jgi:hypothetical protein
MAATSVALGAGQWSRYVYTFTPTDSGTLRIFVHNVGTVTPADTVYIDALQIEERAYATPYGGGGANSTTSTRAGGQTYSVDVYRTDPDGRTVEVRQAPIRLSAGAAILYDYEGSIDQAVSYQTSYGGQTETVSGVVLSTNGVPWLIHPGQPELSRPLGVLTWPTWKRPVDQGVFQPIGRKFRIVVSTRRQSVEGDLQVFTESGPDTQGMEAILADGVALLLKGTAAENAGTRWVSVGDVTQQPFEVDLTAFAVWTLPLVEVDAPSGNALPPATYADASATFFSYSQAQAKAPTYADRSGGLWKV